jgi:hypothetical protein
MLERNNDGIKDDSPFKLIQAAGVSVAEMHERLIDVCKHLTGGKPGFDAPKTNGGPGLLGRSADVARMINERAVHAGELITAIEYAMGLDRHWSDDERGNQVVHMPRAEPLS